MFERLKMIIVGIGVLVVVLVVSAFLHISGNQDSKDNKAKLNLSEVLELAAYNPIYLEETETQLSQASIARPAGIWQPVTAMAEDLEDGEMTLATMSASSNIIEEDTSLEEEVIETFVEEETSRFDGYVLPNVDVYLNIRETPSEDGKIIGKLYVGALAEIEDTLDGWILIHSGSVYGYVSSDYVVTGIEAEEMAKEVGSMVATVNESGLRVRKEPTTDSVVYNIVGVGETFTVVEELEGWVAIEYSSDTKAYLSADYVTVEFQLGEAISIEEELAAIRAAEEAAAKAAAEEAARIAKAAAEAEARKATSKAVETVVTEAVNVTYDDAYLLAALVHMEAGGEPYEGKLAVANVVLNRLKAGYGNTISEVIYAKGQFSGANTGALASRLAKGPNSESIQAANDALAGINNIGDYRNFLATRRANYNSYSEYTIISNHCFYKRR